MKYFISVLVGFGIVALAQLSQADSNLGQLYISERNFDIGLSDCEKAWKMDSTASAGCEVALFPSRHSFLLSVNPFIRNWKYVGNGGWNLALVIRHTSTGYAIQLLGIGKVPKDRFQFEIAKKYIMSALADAEFDSSAWSENRVATPGEIFRAVAMKTDSIENKYEKIIGPVQYVKRTISLRSPAVMGECKRQLVTNQDGRCIIHMIQNSRGDVALSSGAFISEARSRTADHHLQLILNADQGWAEAGSFSLGFMRVNFTGKYNPAIFDALYAEAVRQYHSNSFDVYAHVAQAKPWSNFYTQSNLGSVNLISREINMDYKACQNAWSTLAVNSGECVVKQNWPTPRIGNNPILMQTRVDIDLESVFVWLQADQNGYTVKTFGAVDFLKARPFIEKAILAQPGGKVLDYAIQLPTEH